MDSNLKFNAHCINSAGQLILSSAQGDAAAGIHQIIWDGKNDAQQAVAGGVYIYKLVIQSNEKSYSQFRKMLLLK